MNITCDFLKKIVEFSKIEIPDSTFERAKIALLDYLAVSTAGSFEISNKVDKYIVENSISRGDYKLIARDYQLQLSDSVFLNGLQAHSLDYDDGTNAGIIHLGSPIFSVLLQLAKQYKTEDMKKFYRAVIIGYEASFTIANAIQPLHKARGYHATATCGILGCVIAASILLDYSFEQMNRAFSIAAMSSSGMLKVLDDQSELKPYNVAKTSLLALIAIQMSNTGFEVPLDALGGDRGFLMMMYGSNDVVFPDLKLNGTFAIDKAYIKPFAACRYCHPSIEAAIKLADENNLSNENIQSILVETYSTAVKGHDHTDILNPASGKMSIPYSVAIAISEKKAGLNEFTDDFVNDDKIVNLTKKVEVVDDEELSKLFPKLSAARVNIIDVKGNKYSRQIDYAKGEPENPFTEDEFYDRFVEMYIFAGKEIELAKKIYKLVKDDKSKFSEIYEII